MALTSLGLWYPDTHTPMSIREIVRQAQESVDSYLTPVTETVPARTDLTFGTPPSPIFTGSYNLRHERSTVFLYGSVRRLDGNASSGGWTNWITVATITNPALRPPYTWLDHALPAYVQTSPGPMYQYQCTTAGAIQLRHNAALPNTHYLVFKACW